MTRVCQSFSAILLAFAFAASAQAAQVGKPPPQCNLKALADDAPVDLSQFKGKVVYVDFWASWCGPCSQSMGFLDSLNKKLGPEGFAVVGINVDENRSDADAFLTRYPVKFTQVMDADGQCPGKFEVKAMPSSYLIDRKGIVRHIQLGYRTSENEEIQAKIKAVLAEP